KFAESHGLRSEPGPGGEPVTMLRLDSDTMTTARSYFEALERFSRGEIRVLLGTQMIAKGRDFPGVTLVGVVKADTSVNMPDFRAAERTFQLVSQVAGRAGRGSRPGRVIVQSMEPSAPCIRLAGTHDYVAFAELELACRARAGLPPSGRLVRIVCRDEDHVAAEAAAAEVADALRAELTQLGDRAGRTVLRGPMACPISRIANHYRFAVELLAGSRGVIQQVLAAVRAKGRLQSDAHTAVDVDPVALL
ncbi:MAG: helicase-related protein, partial [Phycisphaerales bacterium]